MFAGYQKRSDSARNSPVADSVSTRALSVVCRTRVPIAYVPVGVGTRRASDVDLPAGTTEYPKGLPVSATCWGLPTSLSEIVMVAESEPPNPGLYSTSIVQEACDSTALPQWSNELKDCASGPVTAMPENVIRPIPVFFSVVRSRFLP